MSDSIHRHNTSPQALYSNTSPTRGITSAASTHGKIRTDKPDLVSLLREKTNDSWKNPDQISRSASKPSSAVAIDSNSHDRSDTQRFVETKSPSTLHASNSYCSPQTSAYTKNSSSRLKVDDPDFISAQNESNNFYDSLTDSLEVDQRDKLVPPLDLKHVNNSRDFNSALKTEESSKGR